MKAEFTAVNEGLTMYRIACVAAIVFLLSGCSSTPSPSPSTAVPSSGAATPSSAAASSGDSPDAALEKRLFNLLLDDDEINALRISHDGPASWRVDDQSAPDDLRYGPTETVDPDRCSDAVLLSQYFEIAGWSGFAGSTRYGSTGGEYGIIQNVAAFPDALSAQHAYGGLADKLRSCGNTSGNLAVKVTLVSYGPFSIEIREDSSTLLRWTFVGHENGDGNKPEYSRSVAFSVVDNMILYVAGSNISDAEPLSIALTQALTRRISSSH